MGELFDFTRPQRCGEAVIEIETEGKPWGYCMPKVPGEENRYITYNDKLEADHEYRIIEVDGREKAERIK
jgi:hypothetical protein